MTQRQRPSRPPPRHASMPRSTVPRSMAPSNMRPLGPAYDQPIENGLLATWDTDRFPSDEYLLTLQVYTTDDEYESASALVTVKPKPTPTPMTLSAPSVISVPIFVDPTLP